jgi:hypothetical protein
LQDDQNGHYDTRIKNVFHSSQCVILQNKKDGGFYEKPAFEIAVYTKIQTRSIGWSGVSEASSAINSLCICSGL